MGKCVKDGMLCYACGAVSAKPRNIGGTRYFLCDTCYNHHIWANLKAVESLKNKNTSSGNNKGRTVAIKKCRYMTGVN